MENLEKNFERLRITLRKEFDFVKSIKVSNLTVQISMNNDGEVFERKKKKVIDYVGRHFPVFNGSLAFSLDF